jgi:hypothetical protein
MSCSLCSLGHGEISYQIVRWKAGDAIHIMFVWPDPDSVYVPELLQRRRFGI